MSLENGAKGKECPIKRRGFSRYAVICQDCMWARGSCSCEVFGEDPSEIRREAKAWERSMERKYGK